MANKFILSGGITRAFGNLLGDGHGAKYAELAELNWDKKTIRTLIKYKTPSEYAADILPSIYFTSASIVEDKLFVGSTTQVFVYSYPSIQLVAEINHPWFNDVHHVTYINGIIYVASTGIDAILGFTIKGELVSQCHVSNPNPWYRRSSELDYRKIASTKPHDNHPNFIFELDGNIWATRFEQKDAVNTTDLTETITIGVERVHDGYIDSGSIFFTTVNGHIVEVDCTTRMVINDHDINKIDDRSAPLGWCRGLCVKGNIAYVAFSKLRSTKIEQNLRWIKSVAKGNSQFSEALPARICKIDLGRSQLLDEFILPDSHMSIIFSVLQA